MGGYLYFSCFAKKSTKRRRLKRALKAVLPRVPVAPLKNLPDAHCLAAEHLNGQDLWLVAALQIAAATLSPLCRLELGLWF